jgi:hypothetical protein
VQPFIRVKDYAIEDKFSKVLRSETCNHGLTTGFIVNALGRILDKVDAIFRNGTESVEVRLDEVQLLACEAMNFFGTIRGTGTKW